MSESDLQLMKAEKYYEEADSKYAEARVMLNEQKKLVKQNATKEKQLVKKENSVDEMIKSRVLYRVEKEVARLEKKYKIWYVALLSYGIGFTLLGVVNNQIVQKDVFEIVNAVVGAVPVIKKVFELLISRIGTVSAMVNNTTLSIIVYWGMIIGLLIGGLVGVGMAMYHCGRLVVNLVKERLWDRYSAAVLLLVVSVIVNLGDVIQRVVDINLVLIGCIAMIIYGVARLFAMMEDRIKRNTVLIYVAGAVLVILVANMLFGSIINSILSFNLILSMICEFGLVIFVKLIKT